MCKMWTAFSWAIILEWPGGFIKLKAYLQVTVYPPCQLYNDLSNSNKTASHDKSDLQKCVDSGCFTLAFNEYLLISYFNGIHTDSGGVFYISASNISDTEHKGVLLHLCTQKKKKISPIKLGLRKRKFKLSVSVTSWVLSHKSLGERSVSESSVSYLRMRSFVERQERERERGRRRLGERGEEERSLGSPQSFGKSRQVALSSWEDSIINDASTRSHLGIPYSLGDLLHLILSRVWCGLPLKRDALHASCIMNDAKETLLS